MACYLKDRHLVGAGAAPCAVCCATPLLTYLGVAGVMATVATVVFTAGTEVLTTARAHTPAQRARVKGTRYRRQP